MVNRGGYNCRHQFSYVNPDWYEEDGEESALLTDKVKPKAVPNPKKSIFGEVSKDEKVLLENAFGTETSPFSKAITFIPALKTLKKSGRGFYRRSDDTLNIGSNRIGVAEEMKVFIHEYTHRIDRIIGVKFLDDKALKLKFSKGVSDNINKAGGFNSISFLKAESLVLDTKVLTKGLKKRRLGFNDEWAKVTAKQPSIFEKAKLEKYYEKLNKELKVVLTDNEIKTYLTSNGRTASQAGIYKFKLKLKNKILAPRYDGGFDLQFSGDFNDYIGAITKETIGAGHGKYNYSKYRTIIRDGNRTFTEGQTLEAWANHSAMTMNPNIIDNKAVKEIERKLMKYFAPNTTKAFDDVVNNFNNL